MLWRNGQLANEAAAPAARGEVSMQEDKMLATTPIGNAIQKLDEADSRILSSCIEPSARRQARQFVRELPCARACFYFKLS